MPAHGLSRRLACRKVRVTRSGVYRPQPVKDDAAVIAAIETSETKTGVCEGGDRSVFPAGASTGGVHLNLAVLCCLGTSRLAVKSTKLAVLLANAGLAAAAPTAQPLTVSLQEPGLTHLTTTLTMQS